MENVPRNVILDLLPVYMAGEASEETRALVEAFARHDAHIATLIRTETLEPEALSPKLAPPDALEMKTMKRIHSTVRRQMWYVALATAAILMLPMMGMLLSDEMNWDVFDFLIMGGLLLGVGFTFVLILRLSDSLAYRAAVALALGTGLLLMFVNFGVGIIGAQANPANWLYIGVLAVGVIGAGMARLRPYGMARALFATALAQLLVPLLALLFWRPAPADLVGMFLLNTFFAMLFAGAAWLFRYAAREETAV